MQFFSAIMSVFCKIKNCNCFNAIFLHFALFQHVVGKIVKSGELQGWTRKINRFSRLSRVRECIFVSVKLIFICLKHPVIINLLPGFLWNVTTQPRCKNIVFKSANSDACRLRSTKTAYFGARVIIERATNDTHQCFQTKTQFVISTDLWEQKAHILTLDRSFSQNMVFS